jgi:hypothetical protein
MHRKLRELAAARGADQATESAVTRVTGANLVESRAREFAERVAEAMDRTVLRYAARRSLLRQAGGLGIGGFEANLIIAAVQHERRKAGVPNVGSAPDVPNGLTWSLAPLLIVIAVETLVALGFWQVCLG